MYKKNCMKCNKTEEENGRALDFSHIVPRWFCKDHEHYENLLLLLCHDCHGILEKKQLHLVLNLVIKNA